MHCHVPKNAVGLRSHWYTLVRILVAAFLWFGAVSKGYQVATEPIAGNKWFTILAVQYEWGLGLILLAGVFAGLGRLVAIATFFVFATVSGHLALQGAEACGCFGSIHVDPQITFAVDLLVIVLLISFQPPAPSEQSPHPKIRRAFIAIGALTALIALAFMWKYEPARLADDGRVVGDARQVAVEPTEWLGKPCPLLRFMPFSEQVSHGRWAILLHHADCPGCKRLLAAWPDSVLQYAPRSKTAIVSIPSSAADEAKWPLNATTIPMGRLPNTHEWFVPTPTIICLDNGIVQEVVIQGERYPAGETPSGAAPAVSPEYGGIPASQAAAPPTSQDAPLAPGNEYSFKYVAPNSTHQVRFVLKNPSIREWVVKAIRSECECIRCVKAPKVVAAGASAEFSVELKAPKEAQVYSKQIVVFTDNREQPQVNYRLKARIGLPLQVIPQDVAFGRIRPDEEYQQIVEIQNAGPEPIRLLYATSTDGACFARIPTTPVAPHSRLAVPIILSRPETKTTQSALEVRFHTNCPAQRTVAVAVRYEF